MVVSFRRREGRLQAFARRLSFRGSQISLKDALLTQQSPASENTTPHVVVVMDALREFTIEPLRWALENILVPGCSVTLLGLLPWLNIPLSSKTPEVWAAEVEELPTAAEEVAELSNLDSKYSKLQQVIDLCRTYDVVLQKQVVMGFPLRLMVIEKLSSLHATWVVFDRHQKKDREFFAKRIPFNMVLMNENGEADMIRGKSMISDNGEFTPSSESPASLVPTPQLMISDEWKQILSD